MTTLRFYILIGWACVVTTALVPFAPIVSFTKRTPHHRSSFRLAASSSDADNNNGNDSLTASSLLSKLPSLDSLPNPFSNLDPNPPLTLPQSLSGEWEATPQGLIQRAKLVLSTDFAIRDPTLLEESFLWIGPTVDKPLNKIDYLAAGRFFDLRQAFPDLDYRAHDFRIDEQDPNTVRVTVRTVGTLRGELRLRNTILPPNGQRMKCPPESITMTFNPATGKLVKLCSGFCMDRLVGNTAGTCGVMAAATIAGMPPSDLELYPPLTVLERFFGRPTPPLEEATTFLAPFPETVMIQLAKGIIAANMAANDPTLLTSSFTFLTPYQGPIAKRQYLVSYAAELFADVDPELSHFRVDPFDPYRVWVDVLPLAPGFIGPPQAMSFTFDDEGFCTRITSGAVMDPSLGNGGGLGGPEGYKYAKGIPSLGIVTRPLPRLLGRLRKKILEPLTGIGADDYALSPDQIVKYELEYDDSDDEDDDPAAPFVSSTVRRSQLKLDAKQDATQSRSTAIAGAAEKKRKELEQVKQVQADLALKRKLELEKQQQEKKAKLEQQRRELEATKREKIEAIEKEKQRKLAEAAKKKAAPVTRKAPLDTRKVATLKGSKSSTTPSNPGVGLFGFLGGMSSVSQSAAAKKDPAKAKAKSAAEAAAKLKRQQDEERRAKEAKAVGDRADQLRKQQAAAQQKREAEAKARADAAAEKQRKQKEEQERRLSEATAAKAKLAVEQERRKQLETEKQEATRIKRQQEEEIVLRAKEAKAAADRAAEELRKQRDEQKQKVAAEARARAEQAADQQQKQQLEQQRRMADASKAKAKLEEEQERKRREVERKAREAEAKAAATRVAEDRRKLEEERRIQAAAEKAAALRAAEEKKIQDEAKKAELARADSERRQRLERQQAAEARKSAAEQKQREAEAKRAAQEQAKRASAEQMLKLANEDKRLKLLAKAPRGVPTLISWKQRSDGGITGKIYGSPNFADGERIETSPILSGALESGNVVVTGSGSRYFLSADSTLTVVNKAAAIKDMAAAKPGSTIALTKAQRERNAKEAEEAIKSAKPRSTISLFGLAGFGGAPSDDNEKAKAPASPTKTTAPRGVPTITKWRRNSDGSLTGNISGSPKFSEGERITTSPIVSGNLAAGEVVTTGSGSRYFLS